MTPRRRTRKPNTQSTGLRMVPEWVDEAAARGPAESVLRRVLDFLALDVVTLTLAQREEWRGLLRKILPLPQEMFTDAPQDADGTLALLVGVKAEAKRGMAGLLRGIDWQMPKALLVSTRTQSRPLRHTYELLWQPDDEQTAIVAGIADLVRRAGETLRQCAAPGCERLFLGQKRGEFCGPEHQQREMNRRKAAARKAARAAKRAKKEKRNG